MKGSVQICKADVCLKADGDFAKSLLFIFVVALLLKVLSKF